MEPREIALTALAQLHGDYLIFELLDHPKAPKVKLSKDELWHALMNLQKEGLVAHMQERLDGPLFTLSRKGRLVMSENGFNFDNSKVEKSRALFSSYFCKTERAI